MTIPYCLQIPTIPSVQGDDVNQILVWIIGILIVFIGALYLYFKNDRSDLKKDLKEERAYNRTQDGKNIELIAFVQVTLRQTVKLLDKNVEGIAGVKAVIDSVEPIIKQNANRLEDIKTRVVNERE